MHQQDNVVQAPVSPKARERIRKERRVNRQARKLRMQAWGGVGVLVVAVFGIAVSLNHMAGGIGSLTKIPTWEAWAIAVVIDMGWGAFKGAEILCVLQKARTLCNPWSKWGVIGTMLLSACLNAFGFSEHAEPGLPTYFSAFLGIVLPFGILALGKVGAYMITTTATTPTK